MRPGSGEQHFVGGVCCGRVASLLFRKKSPEHPEPIQKVGISQNVHARTHTENEKWMSTLQHVSRPTVHLAYAAAATDPTKPAEFIQSVGRTEYERLGLEMPKHPVSVCTYTAYMTDGYGTHTSTRPSGEIVRHTHTQTQRTSRAEIDRVHRLFDPV